jgi:hypothetical protein
MFAMSSPLQGGRCLGSNGDTGTVTPIYRWMELREMDRSNVRAILRPWNNHQQRALQLVHEMQRTIASLRMLSLMTINCYL